MFDLRLQRVLTLVMVEHSHDERNTAGAKSHSRGGKGGGGGRKIGGKRGKEWGTGKDVFYMKRRKKEER